MASFSEKVAEQIVREIEKIINRNINIMDENGLIIASNDVRRIGTFHEGALLVIQEGKPVRIYSDESHRGAKQGVNMPFHFKGELRGVIGITGNPDEVGEYARIIQKMTEVMVKEAYVSRELELEQRSKQLFVQDWLHRRWVSMEDFRLRGRTLSVNPESERLAMLFEVEIDEELNMSDILIQEQLYSIMNKIGESLDINEDDLLVLWQSNQFVLLKSIDQTAVPVFSRRIGQILEKLNSEKFKIRGGIGGHQKGLSGTVNSFEDARQSLAFAKKKNRTVLSIEDLGIEALIQKIPDDLKQEFVDHLFSIFNRREGQQLLSTLRAFLEHGQSINKTSDALFIHKNTLQYRLKKLKVLTGYDPRNFQDAVLYWLALNFHDEMNEQRISEKD